MTPGAAAELVRLTTTVAGVPEQVDDPSVLAKLAALLDPSCIPISPRQPRRLVA